MNIKRQSNVELLRIIASLGVVMLHFNFTGGIDNTSGAIKTVLLFLESLSISSVNIFLIIFGYFSYKKFSISMIKPVNLLTQVVFVNLIFYIFYSLILFANSFDIHGLFLSFVPNNYFIVFYIALYFLSPFINKLMSVLSSKSRKIFVVDCLIIISLYPFLVDLLNYIATYFGYHINDLSTVTREGALDGYTLVNFALMYIIGCFMRYKQDEITNMGKIKPFLMFSLASFIIFFSTFISIDNHFVPSLSLSYGNPIVIVQSVSIMLIFLNMDIKYNKAINKISKASLMCYLVHLHIIKYFSSQRMLKGLNLLELFLYVIFTFSVIYFLSYIAMALYNILGKKVKMLIDKRLTLKISAD